MKKLLKAVIVVVLMALGGLFVAKFAGPELLKLYIKNGIGDCEKIPIFCKAPDSQIDKQDIDKEFLSGLIRQTFPRMELAVPKGFSVIQEAIKRDFYKKRMPLARQSIIYVTHQEKGFFLALYPQVQKQGVKDDYEFLKRVAYAKLSDIKNLTDTFFVIMKGIFTPDLGDQAKAKMAVFKVADKRGFINYNMEEGEGHLFDCNVINTTGGFFKVYIKDKARVLDVDKVLDIVATLDETN